MPRGIQNGTAQEFTSSTIARKDGCERSPRSRRTRTTRKTCKPKVKIIHTTGLDTKCKRRPRRLRLRNISDDCLGAIRKGYKMTTCECGHSVEQSHDGEGCMVIVRGCRTCGTKPRKHKRCRLKLCGCKAPYWTERELERSGRARKVR